MPTLTAEENIDLNTRLTQTFEVLLRQTYIPTEGNTFDDICLNLIMRHTGLKVLEDEKWKRKRTADERLRCDWNEAREKISKGVFLFEHFFSEPFIVNKPNGSQRWPDCVIVNQHAGIPIEFKRTKGENILWNSGIPRENGVYVFNGSVAGDVNLDGTTTFMGQDLLTSDELFILVQAVGANSDVAKRFNQLLIKAGSGWTLYPRPMYNSQERLLSSPKRLERQNHVLRFLKGFDWTTGPVSANHAAQTLLLGGSTEPDESEQSLTA